MIHKFSLNGYNIVLDVYSGAVHVLDDIAFKAVEYIENFSEDKALSMLAGEFNKEDAGEVLTEVKQLIVQGLLFSEDPYKEYSKIESKSYIVKSLCLNIAHDCNLRCEYCFASKGDFGGSRSLMSYEIASKAIDFLLVNSGNRKNLEVDFFGGEPLLNFDVVKRVIEYARKREKEFNKTIKFTLTTNAVLLTEEIRDFINKNIDNIVLSIDGRKEVNARVRYRVDNSGTYDDILTSIKETAVSREQNNYYARGTFTRYNLDFSKDVLHLADQGFKQISVEPVVAGEDKEYALRAEDIETISKEYEKLAVEYIKRRKEGKGFNFFHFEMDLNNGPCVAKRVKGCSAGDEYLAITPEGDIYPCHQFVGNEEFRLGNVSDSILEDNIRMEFRNTNIFTKDKCKDCWTKFYCSGGCAANAWQFNKDIKVPYELGCELQKKRVECALMIQAVFCE